MITIRLRVVGIGDTRVTGVIHIVSEDLRAVAPF